MRGVSSIAVCVASLALACQRGAGAGGAAGGAKIEPECVLRADGATCDMTNRGSGAGARCVKLLLGVRATSSVYESDEACSGRLAQGKSIAVAVRFPQRPASLCETGALADACALRVVDAGDPDAIATWQKELAGGRGGGTGARDCGALAEHVYRLRVEEEVSLAATDEDREDALRYMESDRPYLIEDWTNTCAEMGARTFECVRRARRYQDVDPCWDLGVEP